MKTKALATFLLAAALMALAATVIGQDDMTAVDNSVFVNPQRPASVFVHDAHNQKAAIEDCSQCHHVYNDGQKAANESSEDQRCADCHALKAEGPKPGLRRAFHINCIGCHDARKKGPVICGQCHVNP